MSDDLYDHYADEFSRAIERGRSINVAVPLIATILIVAAIVGVGLGGHDDVEREARPAEPDQSLVLKIPPPPSELRSTPLIVVDRSGGRGSNSILAMLEQAGWEVDSADSTAPPVESTRVEYPAGLRAKAETLARALGIHEVAEDDGDNWPNALRVVVGQAAGFDDAASGAAKLFSVLGPDGQGPGVVDTDYGDVRIELGGDTVCLTQNGGGLCTAVANAASGMSIAVVSGNQPTPDTDGPARAFGLVPDGIDYVTYHGQRIPVRDNIWSAPPSPGPRAVDIPGLGVKDISGLSSEGCETGCRFDTP